MEKGGADGALQADYGGFNPRFLGISLFYDSPDNYNAVARYLTANADTDGSADDLHSIILRSVGDHEARHYTDFLISPYSFAVFRLRLMALVNGVQALSFARDMPGTVLPVPLTRWALLDQRQRAAVCADWEEALGERAEPVPIAERTVDELEANVAAQVMPVGHRSLAEQFALAAEAAMRAYVRIDQLTNGFAATPEHPYLRPAYVHEASALTVQGAAIHRGQGLAETIEFLRFLTDSNLPQATMWQRHLELAMLLERLRSSDDDTSLAAIRRMLTITVWCMLGAYPQDGRSACPASRFGRLIGGLVSDPRNGDWSCDVDDPGSVERMWDFWDDRLGSTSWRSTLSELLESGPRAVASYERLLDSWQDSLTLPRLALDALEIALRDQERLIGAFRADPCTLAVAERYVNDERGELPLPDLRLELRGFGAEIDPSQPGRVITRRTPMGEVYASGFVYPMESATPARLKELDRKLELESRMEWCDLAFSMLSVPDQIVASSRRGLEELTEKRVLQIV
jgi:hypothetical protein